MKCPFCERDIENPGLERTGNFRFERCECGAFYKFILNSDLFVATQDFIYELYGKYLTAEDIDKEFALAIIQPVEWESWEEIKPDQSNLKTVGGVLFVLEKRFLDE